DRSTRLHEEGSPMSSMRRAVAAGTIALVAVVASLAPMRVASANGGQSSNAQLCQKDGWMIWLRADQTAFKNQGECVAYTVRGGMLTSPYPAAQSLCESFGGTFGHDDHLSSDPTRPYLWTCNNLPADFPF